MPLRDGLQPFAYERMLAHAFNPYGMNPKEYLIPVHGQDAARYACNVRCIGDTVIMPQVSADLQSRIEKKGYKVITTDLSHFIYAGGAVHCLTNNLNEQRVIGGVVAQEKSILKMAL